MWRDDIDTARLRLRRVTTKVNEEYLGRSGVFGGRRKIYLAVGLLIVIAAAFVVGRAATGHAMRQRFLLNLAEVRQGVGFMSSNSGGALPQLGDQSLLEMLVDRGLVKSDVMTGVQGYKILAVTPIDGAPDQYSITIHCDADLDCTELSFAFHGNPTLLEALSPPANPLRLVFRL
jgi:hypothetical protein